MTSPLLSKAPPSTLNRALAPAVPSARTSPFFPLANSFFLLKTLPRRPFGERLPLTQPQSRTAMAELGPGRLALASEREPRKPNPTWRLPGREGEEARGLDQLEGDWATLRGTLSLWIGDKNPTPISPGPEKEVPPTCKLLQSRGQSGPEHTCEHPVPTVPNSPLLHPAPTQTYQTHSLTEKPFLSTCKYTQTAETQRQTHITRHRQTDTWDTRTPPYPPHPTPTPTCTARRTEVAPALGP